mmetsp:Transcript_124373/g.348323  ORF Transcript_124373/g.348323 Transcript_124373/m.348323 type:complete len:423 (-) Transcript_124373:19-1287(-)
MNGPGQEVAEATPQFVNIPMRHSREKPGVAIMTVNLTTIAGLSDSLSALVDVLTGFGDFSIYYTYHLAAEVSPTIFGIKPVSVDIAIDRFCEIKFSVGITGLKMEDDDVCPSDAEDFKAKGGEIRDEDGCGFLNSIPLVGGGCDEKRRRLAAAKEASAQRRAKVAPAPSLPVTRRLAVRRLEGEAGQDTPIPADATVAAVDKDMVKKAQTQVDAGLGIMAFCCFVGALCYFIWPIRHFRKHAAQKKKLEQEQKEAEAQAQANAQMYEENYDAYEPPRKSLDMPVDKSQDLPRSRRTCRWTTRPMQRRTRIVTTERRRSDGRAAWPTDARGASGSGFCFCVCVCAVDPMSLLLSLSLSLCLSLSLFVSLPFCVSASGLEVRILAKSSGQAALNAIGWSVAACCEPREIECLALWPRPCRAPRS